MSKRRNDLIFYLKLASVGIGILIFLLKLHSYGSPTTMEKIQEITVENMETHLSTDSDNIQEKPTYSFSFCETETEQVVITTENEERQREYAYYFYEVPYGDLPEDIQIYTYEICKQYGIPTEIVFAIMQCESGFNSEAIGDNGQSFGYMQVMKKWHEERMEKLGVYDLKNPKGNILVAVDYLSELFQRYGDMTSALMAYNCGPTTAQKLWNKGIWQTSYTEKVLKYAEVIRLAIYGGAE